MTTKGGTYTIKEALEKAGFGWFHWWMLLINGFTQTVYSCQTLLPTFLIPILDDVWDLEGPYDSMIGMTFFVGTIAGNFLWAKVGDIYGRKRAIIYSAFVIATFSTATAATWNLPVMLLCRFLSGLGNPTSVSYTLFIEYSPLLARAKSTMLLGVAFTLGGVLSVVLAWLIIPSYGDTAGWRLYLLACSVPAWVSCLTTLWLPESPRYYSTVGDFDNAERALRKVFKMNRVEPPAGHLINENKRITVRGQVKDLFVPVYWRTSVILGINLFNSIMTYFGIIFLSWWLFQDYSLYGCEILTTLAEIPGYILGWFAMNIIGRRDMIVYTIGFGTITFAVIVILWRYLLDDPYAWVLLAIMVFLARCASTLHAITVKLYLSEYYPTAIRATAIGAGIGFGKVGAMTGTFVSEDLHIVTSSTVFTIVSAVGLFTSLLITEDTTHRILTDDVDRTPSRLVSSISKQSNKQYVLVSMCSDGTVIT